MNREISERISDIETDCGLEDLAETVREPLRRITPKEAARYGGKQRKAVLGARAARAKRKA